MNTTIDRNIAKEGITQDIFDAYLKDFVTTKIGADEVYQDGTVNGTNFKLTIRLCRWTGKTTPEQIVTLARLFWQCYPRMYFRFGKAGESPTHITLDIENCGYGIAWAAGDLVHIHDEWLHKVPKDFDCFTHELTHVVQNGWDGDKLEYSDYIERFADACRYLYAFNNGEFNDLGWQLQPVNIESSRKAAARFPVWFDYQYSTPDNDLLLKFFIVCRSQKYPADKWDEAWAEVFKGSALEGRSIDDIWNEYANSEFASLSTKVTDGTSPLLEKYDVRKRLQ